MTAFLAAQPPALIWLAGWCGAIGIAGLLGWLWDLRKEPPGIRD